MPIVIDDKTYYRTSEVCRLIGINRNTLFRWIKDGKFGDSEYRDWRGWRLFTPDQVEQVKLKIRQINTIRHGIKV